MAKNQGVRLGTAKTKGKVSANPSKPALAAKIKLSQGTGGGLTQSTNKAGNVVRNNSRGSQVGLTQNSNNSAAKVAKPAKKGVNKLNKAPISAQPKGPKKVGPAKILRNSVTTGSIARLRKANNFHTPTGVGKGFGSFIGANN